MRSRPIHRAALTFLLASLALLPARAQRGPRRGEKYALLIGVRRYDPNELRSLLYSEPDVVELAGVLKAEGYQASNVVLMTQTAGAEDTRFLPLADNVRKELGLLLDDLEETDSVLVALAGHGVQFRGDPESYFCPADARLADKTTLVALSDVYKQLEACRAGLKVLLVDACRNDPQSDNSRSRSVVNLESATRPQRTPPPGGLVAFFSCSEGQKAYEHVDLKHGVFFHFVIEALRGAAVGPGEAEVLIPDLEKYVKQHVRDFVREKYGVRQIPELRGTSRELVPLVVLGRSKPIGPVPAGPPAKELTNGIGMKFGLIPAGSFAMGSAEGEGLENEHPQHRVKITQPVYLGITEVTESQFERVTKQDRGLDAMAAGSLREVQSQFERLTKQDRGRRAGADFPVNGVSYDDAVRFCEMLARLEGLPEGTYRLPSEAEWEYAARGGEGSPEDGRPGRLDELAWFRDNAGRQTHPVGTKRPNALGLHDMAGNVAEWCSDWLGPYPSGDQIDPTGPDGPGQDGLRVSRGGSWLSTGRACRPVDRNGCHPQDLLGIQGFRVVRKAVPPKP